MDSKKNIHYRIEEETNQDLFKPELDILIKNTSTDAEEIKIRDWFPIYYNGYYAIVGFKLSNNDFFMTEPIVIVYTNRRLIKSVRQYYKLKGEYSLKTYEMFDLNLNVDYIGGLTTICAELFKHGLADSWVKDIYEVNRFIADFYVKLEGNIIDLILFCQFRDESLWSGNINGKFNELVEPRSNYYLFKSCDAIEEVKKLVDSSFNLIKDGKPWKKNFMKLMHENDLVREKLYSIPISIMSSSVRIDRRNMKWIYLWTPFRQNDGKFAICGRIYDNHGQLVDFSSEIRFVHADGVTVETASGFYQVIGPICGLPFERDFNISIVNFVMRKLILQFCYGFPDHWTDLLTILDAVLATGICSWRPLIS